MFGGESDGTVGTLMTGSTATSSLPSAVAAASMEVEDEEDAKRLLGRLREEHKVGARRMMMMIQQQCCVNFCFAHVNDERRHCAAAEQSSVSQHHTVLMNDLVRYLA